MKTIRERYEELETELSKTYLALKKDKKEFIFLSDEDIENGDFDDYFEVRNDITGNTYDVHIIKVDENGIEIVESDDNDKRYYIGFKDLSSIEDRINLIVNMQLCEDRHQ
jgi:hypothetical protein